MHEAWIMSLGASRARGLDDLSRSVSGVEQRGRSRSIMSRLHGDLAGDSGRCLHCGVLAGTRAEWYLSRARRMSEAWIISLGASRTAGQRGHTSLSTTLYRAEPAFTKIMHDESLELCGISIQRQRAL